MDWVGKNYYYCSKLCLGLRFIYLHLKRGREREREKEKRERKTKREKERERGKEENYALRDPVFHIANHKFLSTFPKTIIKELSILRVQTHTHARFKLHYISKQLQTASKNKLSLQNLKHIHTQIHTHTGIKRQIQTPKYNINTSD